MLYPLILWLLGVPLVLNYRIDASGIVYPLMDVRTADGSARYFGTVRAVSGAACTLPGCPSEGEVRGRGSCGKVRVPESLPGASHLD